MGLKATSSELVGLVPLQAMIEAGRHYIGNHEIHDQNIILQEAVDGLGLDGLEEFVPAKSIIELAIRR